MRYNEKCMLLKARLFFSSFFVSRKLGFAPPNTKPSFKEVKASSNNQLASKEMKK